MALLETAVAILGAIAFLALILYLFYGGLHKTFVRVGFTPKEAGIILAGTFIGAFIDIPLFSVNGWQVAINVGGAIVPLVVTYLLLQRRPSITLELIAATTIVAIVTYLVTRPTEQGIVSPFPLYLLPPIAAAAMSLGAFWREEQFAAPLAYMAGTLGAIIGADVFRLPEFLAQNPPVEGGAVASIGGAAVLDMVYLTGILAVGLDALFFSQVHQKGKPFELPYREHTVFTSSTPPEVIRDYRPPGSGTTFEFAKEPTKVKTTMREAARPGSGTHGSVPTRPQQQPTATAHEDPRLERHRMWEERLRGRRL